MRNQKALNIKNFKIESKYGTLEFSRKGKRMLVNGVPEAGKESGREAVMLPLISHYEMKDKKKQIFKKRCQNDCT